MRAMIVFVFAFIVGVDAAANPMDYPACPQRHQPEFYCCSTSSTTREVYTKFHRPTGGSYEDDYKTGWALPRQVNFPYVRYTPDSPIFTYDDPESVCRIQTVVVDFQTGELQQKLQCGSENSSLTENSQDASIFWTSPSNPRNNNASFPIGANCVSLMLADGSLDEEKKKICKSDPQDENFQFTNFGEPPLIGVYFVYLVCFALLAYWNVHRRMIYRRNCTVTDDTSSRGITDLLSRTKYELISADNSERLVQTGYSCSSIGQIVFVYFVMATVLLHILLIIVICDYYDCFTPHLFDPLSASATVFFLVWLFAALWLIAIVVYQRDLPNFFRVPSALNNCEFVHMLKSDDTEIMLTDRTGVSSLIAKVENWFSISGKLRGFQETVRVEVIGGQRIVDFQHLRYVYNEELRQFIPTEISIGRTYADIGAAGNSGLTTIEAQKRLQTIGLNVVDVNMPSLLTSILHEFLTLFYIYQIMCYYVWYYFTYWDMGIVMTLVVLGTAIINIYTKRKMQAAIVKMTRYRTEVSVLRDNQWQELESSQLVPGDLIKVAENWILPCDLVIVKGSTVCDESMLTGESMPVQKTPIPDNNNTVYDPEGRGKKHTLFSGTFVLSSGRNEEIHAVVQTTGAHTTKGQLIQSILFPVPMRFKYDEHLKALIILLLIYSSIVCVIGISFLLGNGKLNNKMTAFCYCIFMISAVVSPLLPVVITVGQVNAATRLQRKGIFSLNVKRITLCGKVRVFCFDKTGTLTKQGLDYLGFQPVDMISNSFLPITKDTNNLMEVIKCALATCHSVGSLDGKLVGNEVEVRMFEATGWELLEREGAQPSVKSPTGDEFEFIKRFDFDHHRMSMSVVVCHRITGRLLVFCKGSYERMQQLSKPDSVPSEYKDVADTLAKNGCYVLGLSYRELPSNWSNQKIDEFLSNRDKVDEKLSLLGLILFRNELKEDTSDAIKLLKKGDIRVVMITGDNAMCGCYIARNSGMVSPISRVILADIERTGSGVNTRLGEVEWRDVDSGVILDYQTVKKMTTNGEDVELAVTGAAFNRLKDLGEMNQLLFHVRIFSRMTPDDKVDCVKMHIEAGAVTGMCGDGGNDCGALRIAHAGIALSDADASVVSPFTSKSKTIHSVVDICREGRCSLATSFASVKFLIMYGVIASTLRLFQWYNATILSEWCFILADGFTLVGLSYVITLSQPLPDLKDQRPTSSLIGPSTLLSILGQETINVIFLVSGMYMLTSQRWYCPFSPDNIDLAKWWLLSDNHLATTLFFTIITQQQLAAWVFSFGSRFRASIWRNYPLLLLFGVLTVLDIYLLLGSPGELTDIFRISSGTNVVVLPDIPMPLAFRVQYFMLLAGNVIAAILFEYFVVLGPVRGWVRRKFHKDQLPMRT
ncbi:putative cation-transporting ATPase 13A3 [Phytophthora cactorum]|uniref:Putative cation-transporting ATPase 13A3 n=1 Tax=Phytophthora cactorum TaxID=29920 RepID=A0A329SIX0_9STRA|nr:putative cation-transporting ATPase 13A3 [Phytophthora cactorum]KAG2837388.1 putative cation-transporting ATPase 13A3 [Phytophthora cactorum]KAG2838237.1 putative cation-transporting ATPase 13A3 [Phytophthora cactorum]KAG2864257.1 putative cation-transporting ATPase 13A3 [Phytophthora cactorum]KAG2905969.1 putative cation-transporting ATPase 13A3 [Phytophthora cactorum]